MLQYSYYYLQAIHNSFAFYGGFINYISKKYMNATYKKAKLTSNSKVNTFLYKKISTKF